MSKLSLALVAAGLSAAVSAYASVPTGALPFQVVVPNLKSGFEFTLEGLLLQPTNEDLDYGSITNATASATFIDTGFQASAFETSQFLTNDSDYNFGFRIGLGYVFPDSGNDVQLAWTHFNHTNSDDTLVFGVTPSFSDEIFISPTFFTSGIFTYELFGTDSASASSSIDYGYDAVDLDVGQYLSIGTRLTTRLFAGLRYAQVKSNLTNNYAVFQERGEIEPDSDFFTFTTYESDILDSKFNGIGPRFGVDASYNVWDCFGVVGHFSAALLVGRVQSSSSSYLNSQEVEEVFNGEGTLVDTLTFTFNNFATLASDNVTRVVPAFDAKVGIDYSWPINNDASRLSIEAGWQVTEYINAVDRLTVDPIAFGVDSVAASSQSISNGIDFERTTSSVGFNGPYLNINFKM